MAAHCEACGGHVMSYGRFAFWTRPTARCAECGSEVRLRHFWTVMAVSLLLVVPPMGLLALFPSVAGGVATAAVVTAVLLALDYVSYHVLTWEIDPAFDRDDPPLLMPPAESRDA